MTRILIVEDDPHVAALVTGLLEFEGYEVVTAVDGLEGLFKVRNADVDAVVLDVMMPDIDGTRVLQQLLEEHDGSLPVPILVMTGSTLGARRCRELLGVRAVIDKPFDPEVLVERVREMLAAATDGPTS
ncbi:MAG: response regulator [Nitriliruptor sp.]|uniref:response regulator transcription factor n=1 Tax=Nitriliruptor sp. TaxID=2448056 RepID=UPI0034A01966